MPDVSLLTVASDGTVEMTLDTAAGVVTGPRALFQRAVLTFLKSRESDVLDFEDGGGIQEIFLSNVNSEEDSEVMAEVANIVRRVRQAMLEAQDEANLPADERLQELQTISVDADPSVGELTLVVRVLNELGQTATGTVVVG